MSSDAWPPALKEWVAKCLGEMSDSNREEAQAELRKVIQDAFVAKTLWTTDWPGMQLQSLQPRAPALLTQNGLKRKAESSPVKKNKKVALGKNGMVVASAHSQTQHHHHSQTQQQSQQQQHYSQQYQQQSPPSNVTYQNAQVRHQKAIDDQVAKERRAKRFEREHQIERQRLPNHVMLSHSPSPSPSPAPMFVPRRAGGMRIIYERSDVADSFGEPGFYDTDHHKIVGTNQEIFKDYLRLTDAPNPARIRPESVLRTTLDALKRKWKAEQNYNWICSQFKSVRQDLTVQGIKNELTVDVYEIHARMAIEAGDLVEFNQCLAALKHLYSLGFQAHRTEFTAYRILYMIHGRQRSELNNLIGELTTEEKSEPAIKHALMVSTAVSTHNYHSLFQLYMKAPNMGAYIMDFFVPRCRIQALMIMCKAYSQGLPVTFIAEQLAFENGVEELHNFLVESGTAFYTNPNVPLKDRLLDAKTAAPVLRNVFETKFSRVAIKGSI